MLQLATSADLEAVNSLAVQVHEMHVQWRPDLFEQAEELYSQERIQDAIRERSLYVAKIDGIVVGYASLKIRNCDWNGVVKRKVMTIDEFAVHEACRGHGIGTQMMEDIHALAKAFRCTDLELGVYPQNEGAAAFYQKCGFTIRCIDMQKKL